MPHRFLKNNARVLVALGCAASLIGLGLRLLWPGSRMGAWLVHKSYDWTQVLLPRDPLTNSPVVIVYLDLASHQRENQNPLEPWDRALHARLLRRLTRAGARAVAFDIIFDGPGRSPEADEALERSIRNNGRVILAGELTSSGEASGSTVGAETLKLILPFKGFLDSAAAWGVANAQMDDDYVVRQIFPGFSSDQPGFVFAAAKTVGSAGVDGQHQWVRYYGGPLTLPNVNYSAALRDDEVNDSFFRDKIVLIGARPMAGVFGERKDEFRSPMTLWGSRDLFMPAVEVHATQLINLLRGEALRRLPPPLEAAVISLAAITCFGIFLCFRPLSSAGLAIVSELALLAGATLLARNENVWFPWLIVGTVQIPGALAGSALWRTLQWYRDKRAFEARIREQSALIDKAQDAIMTLNLSGVFTYANPSAFRLYGWKGGVPADGAQINLAPETVRQLVLASGEWLGELQQKTCDGRDLIVASRWTLIKDANGSAKSFLLINTDITEKKRLEVEFFRAQRLEGVGSLAAGMAHDLNNALAPVLMGVQLLQRTSQSEEVRRMLAVMEQNTHRGADMVRQVLLFSRGEGSEKEPLALGTLVHEMERIMRQTLPKSIHVAALAPLDLWPVIGNSTQLHQALLNLCINARDAMPDGGQLTLAADNVHLTEKEAAEVTNATPGSFVMLLVSDTGCGIPAATIPRIFEPFYTTKPVGQGTGLGLSTTARIVKQHGGFMEVKSEENQGTTFEIYLPTATIAATVDEPLNRHPLVQGRGQLILVADDEEAAREMISMALAAHGYRFITAANGAGAVAVFAQQSGEIALVLIDNDMPALTGEQTILLLRGRAPNLPMILMSGRADMNALPGVGRLAKPFQIHELLDAVSAKLNASEEP